MDLVKFKHKNAIDLVDAAALIKAERGGRLNVKVLRRWANEGYRPRGYEGEPLVLPTVLIGSRLWLMPQWLEAWEAERVKMGQRVEPLKVRTERQGSSAHKQAMQRLQKAGVA